MVGCGPMWRIGSSRFSDSILMTSAPRSARSRVANDPAIAHVKSTMRMPLSGWRWATPAVASPAIGDRVASRSSRPASAPSCGAGPRRPRPRSERNGEPASAVRSPVRLIDVDEEVARAAGGRRRRGRARRSPGSPAVRGTGPPPPARRGCADAATRATTAISSARCSPTYTGSRQRGPSSTVGPRTRCAHSTNRG